MRSMCFTTVLSPSLYDNHLGYIFSENIQNPLETYNSGLQGKYRMFYIFLKKTAQYFFSHEVIFQRSTSQGLFIGCIVILDHTKRNKDGNLIR